MGPYDPASESSPLDAAVFSGLLVAGLMVLVRRKFRFGPFMQWNPFLVLFFLYCGLSTLWSDVPLFVLKHWVKAVGDLVMVLIVLTERDRTAALKRFLSRPGFLLMSLSILFLRYYPALGRVFSPWTGQADNVGISTSKNTLGFICLVFGVGCLWCLLEAVRNGDRDQTSRPLIAYGAGLAMALWLFSQTHSTAAFGCFLMGGGLLVVTGRRALARKPALVHLIVVTVLFAMVYGLVLNPEAGLPEMVGKGPDARSKIWEDAISRAVDPWFGTGYESFWVGDRYQKVVLTMGGHVAHAHSGYIEVYLNLGYIGLALLGLVMVSGYRKIIVALGRDPGAGRLRLAFFVAAVVQNITEHAFRQNGVVWIVFLLSVISLPKNSEVTREALKGNNLFSQRLETRTN
jgi:exopolysaccharide production protein ExoQ